VFGCIVANKCINAEIKKNYAECSNGFSRKLAATAHQGTQHLLLPQSAYFVIRQNCARCMPSGLPNDFKDLKASTQLFRTRPMPYGPLCDPTSLSGNPAAAGAPLRNLGDSVLRALFFSRFAKHGTVMRSQSVLFVSKKRPTS
jgi:hypothetical protein